MEGQKLGNPAVVGLAGFGMTTMMLQFKNLDWCSLSPVLWLGLVFGGGAQLIAGFLEFKKGNNFGFCAFSGYGAFWISLVLLLIVGKTSTNPLFAFTAHDLGWFLGVWGAFTFLLLIASLKHHFTLTLIFLTLFLGFAGLTYKEFTEDLLIGKLAAYDLLLCAALAWYNMFQIVMEEAGMRLPLGGSVLKK